MIFDFIKFSNQAERPDLRLWLSLLLMIIGCLFLNIFKSPSHYISDELAKIESDTGRVTTSDLKKLIIDDPDTIKNLTQDEIIKLFGTANFIRQEGDVLIWQFKTKSCVYEIFWDMKHEQYNILHTNFRPFEPMMTMSSCLKSLL